MSPMSCALLSESVDCASTVSYFHELSARSFQHTATIMQTDVDVKNSSLENGDESEKSVTDTFSCK